jgi:hypothetical protein
VRIEMGLFSSRQPKTVLPPEVLNGLAAFGRARLQARSGHPVDDMFGWRFVGPVVNAHSNSAKQQVIQELFDKATTADDRDLSTFGAYVLLAECDPESRDHRFLELLDSALGYMHRQRLSSGHLTGYEAQRWVEVHGDLRTTFDYIIEVEVPAVGENLVQELEVETSKLLALTDALPDGNAFYAERRADGNYGVFSERQRSSDDRTRSRYEEDQLGAFGDMESLLRALGAMFGRRPYWADDVLDPYFPSHGR